MEVTRDTAATGCKLTGEKRHLRRVDGFQPWSDRFVPMGSIAHRHFDADVAFAQRDRTHDGPQPLRRGRQGRLEMREQAVHQLIAAPEMPGWPAFGDVEFLSCRADASGLPVHTETD